MGLLPEPVRVRTSVPLAENFMIDPVTLRRSVLPPREAPRDPGDEDRCTLCTCGRPASAPADLERWISETTGGSYQMAPSTWQLVRLGVCLPPDDDHAHPLYPAWALDVCWTVTRLPCRLPRCD